MKRLALFVFLLCPTLALAQTNDDFLDNWPRWRGPLATGEAPRGNPPVKWDENTNARWKVALPGGKGSSTPIVWGKRIFVLAAEKTNRKAGPGDQIKINPKQENKGFTPEHFWRFLVLAYDRDTGKELWRHAAAEVVPHQGHQPTHSFAGGSPATDGQRLYASFGSHGIYCYDLDGKLLWKRSLGIMISRFGFGEANTPAVHGDALVVPWDHEEGSCLYCLDAKTGATRWKKDRDEPTNWSTPLIVDHQGRAQVIVNATNRSRGYDLQTGELLWECGVHSQNAIPSPVRYRDTVICMSGYQKYLAVAIPLDARGELTGTNKAAWRYTRDTPYIASPLLVGSRLYFTQSYNPFLTCLDAGTGKVLLPGQRLASLGKLYASPSGAAGRIYLPDQNGTTLVLRHDKQLEVLAANRLEDSFDASPVIVGRQLFLRGHGHLYCLEEK